MMVRDYYERNRQEIEGEENSDDARPLSPDELKKMRLLMRDLDKYLFAIVLIRKAVIGFAMMVGILYGGRDLIARVWKAILP